MESKRGFVALQLFSGSRIILAIVFAVVLITSDLSRAVVLVLIAIALCAEVTDALDGFLARKYALTSTFGRLFDPFVDSLARLTIYFALASRGLAPLWLPVGMCYRDIIVAYLRNFALTDNRVVSARFSGKAKAWAQGIGAPLLVSILMSPYEGIAGYLKLGVSLIVLSITLWSLVDYSIHVLKLFGGSDGS